jgi:protein O-GlcNAc transferase
MSVEIDRLIALAQSEYAAGRLQRAAALFEQVLERDPMHADALGQYAVVALQAGQPQTSLQLAQRCVAIRSQDANAQHVLGLAQHRCGRLADAVESLGRAVKMQPDFFEARLNLGSAMLDAGDAQGALPHYERALALQPQSAPAHNNLGNLYRELRKPAEAIASYRRALALDPGHARAHGNLGNMLRDLGDCEGAIGAFRRSLAIAPNQPDVWSNLLLTLSGSDAVSPEALFAEHQSYGRYFGALLRPLYSAMPAGVIGRRLKVGYISSDFRKHAVVTFFEPLLAAHDRSRFEIYCYYNQRLGDEVTARLRECAAQFVPIAGVPDLAVAQRIRADAIDILVDLNGHTADNRLPLFFLRPAPVQVTWLGYPGSTGVGTMDYRLTDAHADPPGLTEALHTETLWRLPTTQWCYRPYADAPAVGPLPMLIHGAPTFACLNQPGKTSPTVLAMWTEILNAMPQARLLLLVSPHPEREALLREYFSAHGVVGARIEFVARVPLTEYLALYHRCDVALDTYPYSGGTTTCDALWMGVPVVTLAGDRSISRSSASVLHNVGYPELVATTASDYVRIATVLAADPDRLADVRANLRGRMRTSRLTDEARFACDIEAAFTTIWDRARALALRQAPQMP